MGRDGNQAYEPSEAVEKAWLAIYTDVVRHWHLYTLAEKITALEYYFQEWRFKHMKTVARVIGHKPGTGGSSGVNYLVKALNHSFFPELWSMRTEMVAPRQGRSEEHTSELQSLMRISYAVLCLKNKTHT